MTCGTCKYEAIRDKYPCSGCSHGSRWEPKEEKINAGVVNLCVCDGAPKTCRYVDGHPACVGDDAAIRALGGNAVSMLSATVAPDKKFNAGGQETSGGSAAEARNSRIGSNPVPPAPDNIDNEHQYRQLTKPASIGNITFDVGVSEQLVIEAAQRRHEYEQLCKGHNPQETEKKSARTVGFDLWAVTQFYG
jgi:hypothetical protein